MDFYSLLLLFLGILVIGIPYARIEKKSTKKNIIFLFILVLFLTVFFLIHHHYKKTCELLISGDISQVIEFIKAGGVAAPVVSILLMILQAIIAPLPAFLITAANGLLFGLFWGTIISLIGAMGGALFSFFIGRFFYTNYAKNLLSGTKANKYIERASGKYGFKIVLIARLVPIISFDLISYAAGLSNIKLGSFLLATLIGMFPATVIYTAFGSNVALSQKYSTMIVTYSIGLSILLIIGWIIQGLTKK
jgi:uncharacterized membrane protein YdjX (TVP38/TMEM64 family)